MAPAHAADYSLAIKAGVHFTLCGGTIAKLGTPPQHARYFEGLDTLALPGCFGMTELGHGSSVMVQHSCISRRHLVVDTPELSVLRTGALRRL